MPSNPQDPRRGAITGSPEKVHALISGAIELLEEGAIPEAYTKVIELESISVPPIRDLGYLKGICLLKMNQIAAGIEALESEVSRFPDHEDARSLLKDFKQPQRTPTPGKTSGHTEQLKSVRNSLFPEVISSSNNVAPTIELTTKDLETQIKSLMGQWVQKRNAVTAALPKVRYAGPVLGEGEYENLMDALFQDWWSGGKFTNEAEAKLAEISNRNHALLTNSGSSANLLLMSGARELYFNDGDKILTLSCGFPTTVNPIMTNRLIPVFADIDLDTLALDPELLDRALTSDPKIRGVFVAHTLGFKSKIKELIDVVRKHKVEIFFDCCDAYSTMYEGQPIQAYGKAVSYSFYVAHHITMGEGGGVATNDLDLHTAMRGFRNWGRFCSSAQCCIRSEKPHAFCPQVKLTRNSELPDDYIVNYQYEWLGYNLKPLELQAAMLLKQMERLHAFDETRRKNYRTFLNYFRNSRFKFKTWEIDDDVSPFAFPILIPEDAPFRRKHLLDFLMRSKIETRLLFGGNLMRHPAYINKKSWWESFGTHKNADAITERLFMVGVSPVNTEQHVQQVIGKFEEFFKKW